MDKAESDDEILEFEIEIVESSPSISVGLKENTQTGGKVDESSKEEEDDYDASKMRVISQQQTEQVKLDEGVKQPQLIVDEPRELENKTESQVTEQTSGEQHKLVEEEQQEVKESSDKHEHEHIQEHEATQLVIEKSQAEQSSEEVGDKQEIIESHEPDVEKSLPTGGVIEPNKFNGATNRADEVEIPIDQQTETPEVEAKSENTTVEEKVDQIESNDLNTRLADESTLASNDEEPKEKESAELSIPIATGEQECQPEQEEPKEEPSELKGELVREDSYQGGLNEGVESERLERAAASFTGEPKCIDRKMQPDGKLSLKHEFLLEVVEHLAEQHVGEEADQDQDQEKEGNQESPGLSLEQVKQAQRRRVSFGGGISRSSISSTFGEDLEWEFDNEPVFERRQVEVKRNKDVREEYDLDEELGRGRFGTVYKCTDKCGGRKLAAKFVAMRRREDREDVEREVHIMSLLQHKRLLCLVDAFDNGMDEMCLITELIEGGELFERIINDDFELTEKKAAIFMRQICQGVEYMHSQQIVHLDMKPENILCVSKTGNRIKLIDFGLARQLKPDEELRVMFGTPDFAAPEVLSYDTVSLATDMWSVGVICYVLLSGLSPFMGDNDMKTMANVTRATFDFDDKAFEPISDHAKDFISKLLVKEQTKRLKPNECLEHPWLQRGGHQIEANIRSRRESMVATMFSSELLNNAALEGGQGNENGDLTPVSPPLLLSLDKRNLKKYVVRRRWHKTVHAIMALGRMGANLKFKLTNS